MDLENRINILVELGEYMQSGDAKWQSAKTKTFHHNPWFIPEFIDLAANNIVTYYLKRNLLESWLDMYSFPAKNQNPKNVGIVMAGNIPLVGFHDFISCFLAGHRQFIKLSSKDSLLFPLILNFLIKINPAFAEEIQIMSMLRDMDAYIATGSNNSARYFEYYFGKYPSLIRRNRTSVAFLEGSETEEELEKLADDVFLYFGLGCRNVTRIHIPENYDFIPLLQAFRKYQWMSEHHKYKNNLDYRLSLAILNKSYYMMNDCILLLENESPFSPIAVLHYSFYHNRNDWLPSGDNANLQCIAGRQYLPFGSTQQPKLSDYADGADTLKFLQTI